MGLLFFSFIGGLHVRGGYKERIKLGGGLSEGQLMGCNPSVGGGGVFLVERNYVYLYWLPPGFVVFCLRELIIDETTTIPMGCKKSNNNRKS